MVDYLYVSMVCLDDVSRMMFLFGSGKREAGGRERRAARAGNCHVRARNTLEFRVQGFGKKCKFSLDRKHHEIDH